jgi:hypothetical protein
MYGSMGIESGTPGAKEFGSKTGAFKSCRLLENDQ